MPVWSLRILNMLNSQHFGSTCVTIITILLLIFQCENLVSIHQSSYRRIFSFCKVFIRPIKYWDAFLIFRCHWTYHTFFRSRAVFSWFHMERTKLWIAFFIPGPLDLMSSTPNDLLIVWCIKPFRSCSSYFCTRCLVCWWMTHYSSTLRPNQLD